MTTEFKPYPFTAKQYAATLPPLDNGVEAKRQPVVIVGGGPVGFTAALALANHGVPSVVIEADDSVCYGSRAICISRRSLEIIERAGAVDGFLKVGLPWTGGRSFYHETEVLHFTMPQDENQKLPPMVNLAQYHIEQFLLDTVEKKSDLIDVRWQTKVTAIQQDANGATLTLTSPAGDYAIKADWVVAADGGRSTIREALGLQLKGTSYEGRYVIVDILMDSQRPTERLAYFDPTCNRGSTVLVHKQPDNVWRIDYQLRDGEDPDEAIKPENVLPRVQSLLDMMGEKAEWSPIWITIYKANALTLESYRHNRVLFAGDAAHLVPIFGVRGANSGIDDADNLAWKLAFVVKGLASDKLLDTYSDERVFATHENLSYGTKSTEFMAPPSFAFDLMRKAVLSLAVKHPEVSSLINPRQTSAITYVRSPLNVKDDDFAAGPIPGAVLPECPLALIENGAARDGHLTDLVNRVAPRFTLFHFSEDGNVPRELAKLEDDYHGKKVPFAVVPVMARQSEVKNGARDKNGKFAAMYGAKPGTAYLVRPDGHVLGRWHNAKAADVAAAIEHVLN
jgi:3-(3-hydroxy-phenyl)propionate hydroxylase